MTVHRAGCLLLVGASLALTACARHADRGDSSRSVGSVIVPPRDTARLPATVQDTNVELQERLSRLEREARALARTDGCDSLAQCRTAPVGWRSCGGPRTYLVYCAATTDTVTLFDPGLMTHSRVLYHDGLAGIGLATSGGGVPPDAS